MVSLGMDCYHTKTTLHLHWFSADEFVLHRKRSIHSILGTARADFPWADAHVEFHFLGTHLLNIQNKETNIFAVFTLQDEHTTFFTLCTTRRQKVGWTDIGHLAILYICIYMKYCVCMYMHIHMCVCVCVCVWIHTHFYLRLSLKWHVCLYIYTHTHAHHFQDNLRQKLQFIKSFFSNHSSYIA